MRKQREQKREQVSQEKQEKKEEKFSLYVFMELEQGPSATMEQIEKKQYKKLVIKYHPDKNQGNEQARAQFQKLRQAYEILTDEEKRKRYDECGFVNESQEETFQTAYQYMRGMFKKIEKEDIDEFEKEYRFGNMEKEDLIQYYQRFEGDMIHLLEWIPLSKNEDIVRYIEFFEQEINQKRLKKYKNFALTRKKVKKLKIEKIEEEKEEDMKDLMLAIRNKPKASFLENLQAKYCGGNKKVKAKQPKRQNIRKKKPKQ